MDHKENLISYEILLIILETLLIILEIPVDVYEILVINYWSDESKDESTNKLFFNVVNESNNLSPGRLTADHLQQMINQSGSTLSLSDIISGDALFRF